MSVAAFDHTEVTLYATQPYIAGNLGLSSDYHVVATQVSKIIVTISRYVTPVPFLRSVISTAVSVHRRRPDDDDGSDLIQLFFARCYGRGATGDNRSKIQRGEFGPKFQVECDIPRQ